MFTFMLLVVLYIFSQCFAIFGLMNLDITNIKMPIPVTVYEVVKNFYYNYNYIFFYVN